MTTARQAIRTAITAMALFGIAAIPLHAQGRSKEKHYAVSNDKALSVSRKVLVEKGYEVVRVERVGATQVVYFRTGNKGRGKGKGPMKRMVIRTVRDRVLFEEADPAILVDIDVRLKL